MYTERVLKDQSNGHTIIQINALLRIKEPTFYYLQLLGINYTTEDVEYKYVMKTAVVQVYSPVRMEANTPVQVICLGYPLLYEARITTVHELEFEYTQDVVYKQIVKTEYGYLAKLWLSYASPGQYETWPMRVTAEGEQYYSPSVQITVVPFEADLYFSSRAVKVGEPLDFTIEIRPLEEGFKVEQHLSAWGSFKVDNLEVENDESYKMSGSLKLFALAGNEYLLGPISFQYACKEGSGIFYLPAIPIWLQRTASSDAYELKGLQYRRDLHMSIWNGVVLGLLFIVVLLAVIKIVKRVRNRKPGKEEGTSYRQKLIDAWQKDDWLAMACLIKQKIGESMGLTAEESLSLTVEECDVDGLALKILKATDRFLFANEPVGLMSEQIDLDELLHSLKSITP